MNLVQAFMSRLYVSLRCVNVMGARHEKHLSGRIHMFRAQRIAERSCEGRHLPTQLLAPHD
jgi:hypothetical protein